MEKIDIDKLKSECPKAYKEYIEWIKKVTGLGEEGDKSTYADVLIIAAPRMLFDFFDLNEVYISIGNTGGADQWTTHLGDIESFDADSRAEAEQKGFMEAFKKLEVK